MSEPRSWWRVFRWPIVLAVAILAGLVLALVGEHVGWRAGAWLALGAPVVIVGRALISR